MLQTNDGIDICDARMCILPSEPIDIAMLPGALHGHAAPVAALSQPHLVVAVPD
jgi:hypothetical protein